MENESKAIRLEEADEMDKSNAYYFAANQPEVHEQLKLSLISGKDMIKLWNIKSP